MEDILEKVDLSIVFEFQHVFEHVGKLPEFKQMYIERREVRCCCYYCYCYCCCYCCYCYGSGGNDDVETM